MSYEDECLGCGEAATPVETPADGGGVRRVSECCGVPMVARKKGDDDGD